MKQFVCMLFVLLLPLVSASHISNETTAEGGNVTRVDIVASANQTQHWQGLAGQVFFGTDATAPSVINATGSLVNATNMFFQIDCDNPTAASGFIFLSNSSAQPTGLTAGNLTLLDALTGTGADTGTSTFTATSSFALTEGTVAGVPTVYSFVNETSQNSSFREGYFNQNGTTLVFATVIEVDLLGYNRSFFDYQALVVAPNLTTVPYYLFGDITFTCPAVPGVPAAGGGSGGRRYFDQLRKQLKRPNATSLPPRREHPLLLSDDELEQFLRNLRLLFEPAQGEILQQTPVQGTFDNANQWVIDYVSLHLQPPEILVVAEPAHPAPRALWNWGGWADHGAVEPKVLLFGIHDVPVLGRVAEDTTTSLSFIVVPPIMQPQQVAIGVEVQAEDVRLISSRIPFTVTVPAFAVAGIPNDAGVLTVYYLVDNRGKGEKDINIELALNRRRNTLVGELIGPLRVPADRVIIYGHEYALTAEARTANVLEAQLRTKDETLFAQYRMR